MDEQEIRRNEVDLAQEGWASHVRLERSIREWARLAREVNVYEATVDDYTNDVCSRDYIAEFLARASDDLRSFIAERVEPADDAFRAATVEDTELRLDIYFRTEPDRGWWWHRRPSAGPLANYLAKYPAGD